MTEVKKNIMLRVYVVFFSIVAFALSIVFMLINIQVINKSKYINVEVNQSSKYIEVEPVRGNVYALNGEILATTMLYYDIRMDLKTEGLSDKLFSDSIAPLCEKLATFFGDKSAYHYQNDITQAKARGSRWHLIQKDVSYPKMRQLKKFPLFNLHRYKSGLICIQKVVRKKPYGLLAERTIGRPRDKEKGRMMPSGIEGGYDKDLVGEVGLQFSRKLPGGGWMPLQDNNTVDPVSGGDVYSTIDIELQDVAEDALHRYLVKNHAEHGCVVLMETKTGAIRAIANLRVDSLGNASESRNYAVWEGAEPGSTFKLASLMAAFEDGHIDLEDKVDTENGVVDYYDLKIRDSRLGGYGVISVKEAFKYSSNTAISKLVHKYYNDNRQGFVDRLFQFGLDKKLGVNIPGESKPEIKGVKEWSGVSLPQISIGYEVHQTPLQTLTFYNAVANNGTMVKPKFVEKVVVDGKESLVNTVVLKNSICSKETLDKAHEMLEAVVESGTAKNLKNDRYKIAGKTGTTQLNYWRGANNMSYKASFVGYFPADEPEYSCIVVVSTKSTKLYYGSHVAGPIFKEVADKVYAGSINIHDPINSHEVVVAEPRDFQIHINDLERIQDDISIENSSKDKEFVGVNNNNNEAVSQAGLMPNVVGMGLKDAMFLLENKGLILSSEGNGRIKRQSIRAGQKINRGQTVKVILS